VLTGEGADEILSGYLFHKVIYWARQYAEFVPGVLRNHFIGPLIKHAPNGIMNLAFDYPAALGKRGRQKISDYHDMLDKFDVENEYLFLISLFDERDKSKLYSEHMKACLNGKTDQKQSGKYQKQSNYLDAILSLQYKNWLPDDILMKQDKMTMANSVEGRVPFMDHELVEFLLKTPSHMKLRGLTEKVVLRKYLRELFPKDNSRRRKKPFYVPLDKYFSKDIFKNLIDVCLSEQNIKRRDYFDWKWIQALRDSVNHGDFIFGKQVLSLVVLELWHKIFIDKESGWVS